VAKASEVQILSVDTHDVVLERVSGEFIASHF
jgi:hypothetical protein